MRATPSDLPAEPPRALAEDPAATPRPPAPAQRMRWWRRVPLRRQMLYGLALPVAIVLLSSLYLVWALDGMARAATASVETADAVGLRYKLLNVVLDSETGLRGYLLSGDPDFLGSYERAPAELRDVMTRLATTEAAEPRHMDAIRTAHARYWHWRRDFASPLIALRRTTPVGTADELRNLAAVAPTLTATADGTEALRSRLHSMRDRFEAGRRRAQLDALIAGLDPAAGTRPRDLPVGLATLANDLQQDIGRITTAIQSKRGKRIIDEIRALVEHSLREELEEEREHDVGAQASANRARWIALLAPVTALVVGLSLVLLLLVDAIRAIGATTKAAAAVAAGDLDKRIRELRQDEIGELGRTFNRMASELADRRRRSQALDRFQALLGTSNTMEELYAAVENICTEMFPHAGGAIFRIAASRNLAECVARWHWPAGSGHDGLDPEECRAVRAGRPYLSTVGSIEVPCRHTARLQPPPGTSLCLPLSAHGEILGIMQLCIFGTAVMPSDRNVATAVLIGEQLSLALANLELREKLRNQSIRDPLTGLFNRRYLEETLARELARCARSGQPLALAVIDVDHFKRFNDTHGHEAGDRVLVELAAVLRHGVRSTDIACRYGGEEFVLLMPDTLADVALARADALRQQAARLQLRFGSGPLEPVTFSAGLATAPAHATSADALLRAADTALYEAKARGRDRVVAYQPP